MPCELEEEQVTRAHSSIITDAVLETAKQAGAPEHNACVVFCLLQVKKWFKKQATAELWDADLHEVRAVAAEIMAKRLIEAEEDTAYLFEEVLLKRYSTLIDGEPTTPANAVEKAVDLHAVTVIGSSGYQKCINYLWRGWVVQDDEDPSRFVPYENKTNTSYWAHLDPDRMRVPKYQNWVQIATSLIFLGLYTGAINTINPSGDLDVVEGLLYLFTLGFICDEANKFWKVGRFYVSFWNMFNSTLYALLTVSFVLRMVALGHPISDEKDTRREYLNKMSYDFLAFTAPMFWMRLLLYLDTFRFFGAMLVVLKVMMRESLIFFMLLLVVMIGFFQAFIGLDIADDQLANDTVFVFQAMLNAVMQSPEFEGFDNFSVRHNLFDQIKHVLTSSSLPLVSSFTTSLHSSSWLSCSTFLLLSTTPPTKTLHRTPSTNTWHFSPRRRCNSSALPTRTSSSLPSTSSRCSVSSFHSSGGWTRSATTNSTTWYVLLLAYAAYHFAIYMMNIYVFATSELRL